MTWSDVQFWGIGVGGLLIVAAAWRFLGWRGALAALAALSGALAYKSGQNSGRERRIQEERIGLEKQKERWNEIDNRPRDLDRAIDRLHGNKDRR